jgi:hypothetical protein
MVNNRIFENQTDRTTGLSGGGSDHPQDCRIMQEKPQFRVLHTNFSDNQTSLEAGLSKVGVHTQFTYLSHI